jgi:hypothetical protein
MADRKARYDRRQGARGRRQQESRKARLGNLRRKLLLAAVGFTVTSVAVIGVVVFMTTRSTFGKILPPTGFSAAHFETFPPRQINSQPIHRLIQEHVMERNATHPNGAMLVQYNCSRYDCEPGLVENLTEIVLDFPATVYLAPYPEMDAKIALAAPGRLLTLDIFDRNEILKFITDNLDR